MFEKDLERRLKAIFGVKKTTFLAPDENFEQDTLFIQITEAKSRLMAGDGGRETYNVKGYLTIYSQNTRIPFGFFMKKLEQGDPADTAALIFEKEMDIENSPARIQNLQERRINFMFLYDTQYDPSRGSITTFTQTLDFQE